MKRIARREITRLLSAHPHRALTLKEVLVVLAVVALLAAVVLPLLARTYHRASRINCVHNLKIVGAGFRLWATDHHDRFPQRLSTNEGGTLEFGADIAAHFRVLSNQLLSPKVVVCPTDANAGALSATSFATLTASNISYFLGLEAEETPPQMILSGDANLTSDGNPVRSGWFTAGANAEVDWGEDRHQRSGNVGFADGSVMQMTGMRLMPYFRRPPNLTNRFLLP